MDELVQAFQTEKGLPRLAILSERSLKIIAGDRHIVRIAGRAALLIQSAGWIEAAVVHVIAGKVVAASELCQRERLGIERRNDRAAVVRTLIARPDLAGQKRHGMCRRGIRAST